MARTKPDGPVVDISVHMTGELAARWLAHVATFGKTPPTNSSLAASLIGDGLTSAEKKAGRKETRA